MTNSMLALPRNLFRLFIIRCLMLLALGVAIIISLWSLHLHLNYILLTSVLTLLTLVNALTWLRLRRDWPVTELEIFAQLLVDVAGLSLLMYFSGGAGNPFIFYYLVPVCISAATLPWVYSWTIAGLSLALYTLQLSFFIPLPLVAPTTHHQESGLSLHIIGMWCNFAISAILITYFVAKMAQDLRRQESLLNAAKEDALRNEKLMAVATLAAGTAHELGTPLSTIMVLLDEMLLENSENKKLHQDLSLLAKQTETCRQTLRHLVFKADTNASISKKINLSIFFGRLFDHWLVIRPEISTRPLIDESVNVSTCLDPGVEQSIMNLLNNAADANPDEIEIQVSIRDNILYLSIRDRGPGIPEDISKKIGSTFVTTKGKGLGLGLFLSHATLSRLGGTITLSNRVSGGTLTEMSLPIHSEPDEDD